MAAKKTPHKRRHYTDSERATALATLAANGGNLARTAAETGVPAATLAQWRNAQATAAQTPKKADPATLAALVEVVKLELDAKLERNAHFFAEAMGLPEKIAEATLAQLATALGVTIEKMRLLREQATSINANRPDLSGLSDADLDTIDRLATAMHSH